MTKRVRYFLVLITLALLLVGCSKVNLEEYKNEKIDELSNLVAKIQSDEYTEEDFLQITTIFDIAKKEVKNSNNTNEIDQAISSATNYIKLVPKKPTTQDTLSGWQNFIIDLKLSDITKVEKYYYFGTMVNAPLPFLQTTTDERDIQAIYQWLKGISFVESFEEYAQGGSEFSLKVYAKNRVIIVGYPTVTRVNYMTFNGYKLEKHDFIPELNSKDIVRFFDTTDTFCYFVKLYTYESKDYQYDYSKLRFIELQNVAFGSKATYRLQTPVGMLYLYDAKIFQRQGVFYQITSEEDFSIVFDDFPTTPPTRYETTSTNLLSKQSYSVDVGYSYWYEEGKIYPQLLVLDNYQKYLDIKDSVVLQQFEQKDFESHSFVLITLQTSNTERYALDNIYFNQQGDLLIRISEVKSGAGATVMGECYIMIIFDKSVDLSNNLDVIIIYPILATDD